MPYLHHLFALLPLLTLTLATPEPMVTLAARLPQATTSLSDGQTFGSGTASLNTSNFFSGDDSTETGNGNGNTIVQNGSTIVNESGSATGSASSVSSAVSSALSSTSAAVSSVASGASSSASAAASSASKGGAVAIAVPFAAIGGGLLGLALL